MDYFITDEVPNYTTILSYHGQMLKMMNRCTEPFLIIIKDEIVESDYLSEKDYFSYLDMKQRFSMDRVITLQRKDLHDYLYTRHILSITSFCRKSISINHPHQTHYHISKRDPNNGDILFISSNSNKFEKFEIVNIKKSFSKGKLEIRKEKNINHKFVIFLYISDDYSSLLDKIFMTLSNFTHFLLIIYYPHFRNIESAIQVKPEDIVNGVVNIDFKGNRVTLKADKVDFTQSLVAKFDIVRKGTKSVFIEHLMNSFSFQKVFIKEALDDNTLAEYLYLSDVFIPLCKDFTELSLLAQKYSTYSLFVTPDPLNREYCLYGKCLVDTHEDFYYNEETGEIEKVLRIKDVRDALVEYLKQYQSPFFNYGKEFAQLIF
jgi:hypothetical protein